MPLSRVGVSVRLDRLFFDYAQLENHCRFNLGYLGSDHDAPNREPVATHLLFATIVMPHAVLLFITAAAGFALGALLTLSVNTKRKKIP